MDKISRGNDHGHAEICLLHQCSAERQNDEPDDVREFTIKSSFSFHIDLQTGCNGPFDTETEKDGKICSTVIVQSAADAEGTLPMTKPDR